MNIEYFTAAADFDFDTVAVNLTLISFTYVCLKTIKLSCSKNNKKTILKVVPVGCIQL